MSSTTWDQVHVERHALIGDLEQLSADSWETNSLCAGWTVHDVVAHLIDNARTTKLGFVVAMVRARFDFDRLNQRGLEIERRDAPEATLERLRAVADRTSGPPAPEESRLVEEIVHGEDIRRPLGIARTYPTEALLAALDYQIKTSDSVGGSADLIATTRLVATDADWSVGAGSEVEGTLLDLLLLATGRLTETDL